MGGKRPRTGGGVDEEVEKPFVVEKEVTRGGRGEESRGTQDYYGAVTEDCTRTRGTVECRCRLACDLSRSV